MPATPEPADMRLVPPAFSYTAEPSPEPTLEPETEQTMQETEQAQYIPWEKPVGAFSIDDMTVDTLMLFSTVEQVTDAFGEPVLTEPYIDDATGASFTTMAFDGLYLHLRDGKQVTRATIIGGDYSGPRGLKIGDSYERVLSIFVRDSQVAGEALELPELEEAEILQLYGDYVEESDIYVPPMGVVDMTTPEATERGEFIVRFLDYSRPYTEQMRLDGSYQYELHGACVIYVHKDDLTVTRINWTYNALAE